MDVSFAMSELLARLGLTYKYNAHNIVICNNNWTYPILKLERFHTVNEMLNNGLLTRKQAREMIGLE